MISVNRPFPSCLEPHFESEAKCKVFIMKISFIHTMKSFARSLAFIMRFTATRKWSVRLVSSWLVFSTFLTAKGSACRQKCHNKSFPDKVCRILFECLM